MHPDPRLQTHSRRVFAKKSMLTDKKMKVLSLLKYESMRENQVSNKVCRLNLTKTVVQPKLIYYLPSQFPLWFIT